LLLAPLFLLASLASMAAGMSDSAPEVVQTSDRDAEVRFQSGHVYPLRGPVIDTGWADFDGDLVDDFWTLDELGGPGGDYYLTVFDLSTNRPYLMFGCGDLLSPETAVEGCQILYDSFTGDSTDRSVDLIAGWTRNGLAEHDIVTWIGIPNHLALIQAVIAKQRLDLARAQLALAGDDTDKTTNALTELHAALAFRETHMTLPMLD
jgi:hypothetical protein